MQRKWLEHFCKYRHICEFLGNEGKEKEEIKEYLMQELGLPEATARYQMIRALEDKAVSLIGALISVNVPENAWEFFEHEEYVPVGDIFVDNGVKYKKMKRDLTKIRGCRGGCHK